MCVCMYVCVVFVVPRAPHWLTQPHPLSLSLSLTLALLSLTIVVNILCFTEMKAVLTLT